ncbi:MAG: PKD domain-containing protein [Patescibacteria group bacterium]
MKGLLKRVPKMLMTAVMTMAILAGVATTALAGFGPNRTTKAWSPNVDGFDHVTFNSFTGVPNGVGDERDFIRGVQVGRDNKWSDPVNGVTQGAEVEAKIYIHNNADARLNSQPGQPGVAKDVKVKVELPKGSAKTQQAKATISASNALPKDVFDTLDMTGANGGFFEIAYVPGSAKLHRGGKTTALGDNLVTTGVNLGDQKGCFDFIEEVTFRMKVNMPRYTIQKEVRHEGGTSNDWKENVNIDNNKRVEWLITFKNTGATELKHVKIVDEVPVGLTVVPGSVKLINGNYPSGFTYPDSAIQANGRQVNVDIGNYNPGILAYVLFKTNATPTAEQCGKINLVNKAFSTPEGYGAIWDTASVDVNTGKECKGPTFSCKSASFASLGGRKIRVTITPSMSGNVKVKSFTYDFGDSSVSKVVTDKANFEHDYAADGTYSVKTSVTFVVDGKDKTVTSDSCAFTVTFKGDKPVTPPTTPPTLPNTGAGDVIGVFAAVTVAGSVAHRVFTRRFFQ